MKKYNEVPVIDLSTLLYAKSMDDILKLAANIRDVYTSIGFAYIVNHGISKRMIDSVFNQSRLFHHLPTEVKLGIKQNEFFRGYMPLDTSILKVSTLGKAVKPNQSAAFVLAHEVSEHDPNYQKGINLAGKNQWLSDDVLPNFKNTLLHYREDLSVLVKNLIRVFSLSFGHGYYDLDQYFSTPTTFLRLQYYPEQPEVIPENQYGIAPHTDYGFLTILAQDSVGGLQVKSHDGSWIDVPYLEGSLILNTGDMIRRLSNETYISTPHRVINTSGVERYSVPFFFEPSMHAHIAPMPECIKESGKALYDSMEYCDYLMERIKGNYDLGAK